MRPVHRRRPAGTTPQASKAWGGADGTAKVFATATLLLVLLPAVVLFGLGFALKVLWRVAAVVLVVRLLGFVLRAAEGGGRRRRYRW